MDFIIFLMCIVLIVIFIKKKNSKNKKEKLMEDGWVKHNKNFLVNVDKKIVKLNDELIDFNKIIDAELIEDGASKTRIGVGLIFPRIVTTGYCNELKIRIILNDINDPYRTLSFVLLRIKKNNIIYRNAFDNANKCLAVLKAIIDQNKKEN